MMRLYIQTPEGFVEVPAVEQAGEVRTTLHTPLELLAGTFYTLGLTSIVDVADPTGRPAPRNRAERRAARKRP